MKRADNLKVRPSGYEPLLSRPMNLTPTASVRLIRR
jgi:hypothetical protein